MIIVHPRIYPFTTANRADTVEAFQTRGAAVVALGSEREILALREPGEDVVRPEAACILPGLIDTHAHLTSLGQRPSSVDIPDETLPGDIAALVAANAATLPAGSWVTGRAWNQAVWPDATAVQRTQSGFPTHHALTAAAPNRPVMLRRTDHHAVWLNRAALEACGLWGVDVPDPEGGTIDRGTDGLPAGVLVDEAIGIAKRAMPPITSEETRLVIRQRARAFLAAGITCVHCALVWPSELSDYAATIQGPGRTGLRVRSMVHAAPSDLVAWARNNRPYVDPDGMHHVVTLKAFADGALGSKGAWFFAPYEGDTGVGKPVATPAEVEELARVAIERGFQFAAHAIGDRAIRETADAYARAGWSAAMEATLRFRIEHVQHSRAEDLDRLAALRIAAPMQPIHCTRDMRFAERFVGPARAAFSYPWRSVLDRGMRLGFGSDFPIETLNPWVGLHAAVTRQDEHGLPEGGWIPQQRVSMGEALDAYLVEGARLMVPDDGVLGHLGEVADFVAIDTDPFVDSPRTVADTTVRATVVAGELVHGAF